MTANEYREIASVVDSQIRAYASTCYEVWYQEDEDCFYINAPLYEEESEDPHAFCAVFICDADLISDAEELFRNALHASVTVDRLMAAREKAEAF